MEPSRGGRGKPTTVLVVDDENGVRDVILLALDGAGLRIVTAGSGSEALAVAGGGQIDLLIADLSLPDLSGPVLAARLQAEHPALRVIYVSGWHDPDQFPEIGDAPLLAKPFTFTELRTAVARALDDDPRASAERS